MKIVDKFNKAAGSNRRHLLPGLDGRSRKSRRFRDLVTSLSEGISPFESLSEEHAALVRQTALLMMAAESTQSAAISGEAVDVGTMLETTATLERLLKELRTLREQANLPLPC